MTLARVAIGITGTLVLLCAIAAAGQEQQPLSLTGNLYGGYTGTSNNGAMDSGPYVGLDALVSGFWKDPRILSFSIQPDISRGFTRTGTMSGPMGEGVSATSTFLGGSRTPVTFYYTYQFVPSPDVNTSLTPTNEFLGIDQTRKMFGVDWNGNFRHLPPILLSFRKSEDDSEIPELNTMENRTRDFLASTHFDLLKWRFSGSYSNNHGESGGTGLDGVATTFANSDTQSANGTALRALPLTSTIFLEGGWNSTDLDVAGSKSQTDYKHGSASLSSQPISRLTMNLHATYLSSLSDYLRAQILDGQPGTVTPDAALLTGQDTLTYGAGANFRIIDGLAVNGNYNATEPLDSTGDGVAGGGGHGVGAGVTFNHQIRHGQFYSAYNHATSQTDIAIGGTGIVVSDSTMDNVTAGYNHSLPFGITGGVGGSYSTNRLHYTYEDNLRNWGLDFQANRRIGNSWSLASIFRMRSGSHDYPYRQEDGSKSFSASLQSARLQFLGVVNKSHGLAYQFGNQLIFVPETGEYINVTGLPPLSQSDSSSYSFSVGYKVNRRLTVNGTYYRGSSGASSDGNTAFRNFMTGYDIRARYRFRQVWLVGGYRRDIRSFEEAVNPSYAAQSFYIMVRREFRLF